LLAIENETKIDPGESKDMKLMLINIGDLNDIFILNVTSLPSGIRVTFSEDTIELDFDETAIITLTIRASSSIERGKTLYLNITATSTGNSSLTSTVSLKIKTSTSIWSAYLWLYITLILLFVGVIIWQLNKDED